MGDEFYIRFKDEDDYKNYLFSLKWPNEKIICPHCNSLNNTTIKGQFLYHCNLCNTNHSLTTSTIMQNSKLDLRAWFNALVIFTMSDYISYRKFSSELNINKKTGNLVLNKLYFIHQNYKLEIAKIIGIQAEKEEIFSKILLLPLNKGRYISGKQ